MGSPGKEEVLASGKPDRWGPIPRADLRHLMKMTDCTGMFQHARYSVPDPQHGYCIDDNARALIAGLLHAELFGAVTPAVPVHRYLMFLSYAYNESAGAFRNFMSYDRRWLEAVGSPDSQGRAIWALGLAVSRATDDDLRDLSAELFTQALAGISDFCDLRSRSFAILGLEHYLTRYPEGAEASVPAGNLRDRYAGDLMAAFTEHASDGWPWCEDRVIYDNAKVCHALLVAGRSMGRDDMIGQG